MKSPIKIAVNTSGGRLELDACDYRNPVDRYVAITQVTDSSIANKSISCDLEHLDDLIAALTTLKNGFETGWGTREMPKEMEVTVNIRGYANGTVTTHVTNLKSNSEATIDQATHWITTRFNCEIRATEAYIGFSNPGHRELIMAIAPRKNGKALMVLLPSEAAEIAEDLGEFKMQPFSALPKLQGFLVLNEDVLTFLETCMGVEE